MNSKPEPMCGNAYILKSCRLILDHFFHVQKHQHWQTHSLSLYNSQKPQYLKEVFRATGDQRYGQGEYQPSSVMVKSVVWRMQQSHLFKVKGSSTKTHSYTTSIKHRNQQPALIQLRKKNSNSLVSNKLIVHIRQFAKRRRFLRQSCRTCSSS